MEAPAPKEPSFFTRMFIRPLLNETTLGWKVPFTGGKNILGFLASTGRLGWVAPEKLEGILATKKDPLQGRAALNTSIALHPDKTPRDFLSAENLLAPVEIVESYNQKTGVRTMSGKSRLASIYDQGTLDGLPIRPQYAKQADAMRMEISRLIKRDEKEMANDPNDRLLGQIEGGKRWLAKMDEVMPPSKPVVKPLSMAVPAPDIDEYPTQVDHGWAERDRAAKPGRIATAALPAGKTSAQSIEMLRSSPPAYIPSVPKFLGDPKDYDPVPSPTKGK